MTTRDINRRLDRLGVRSNADLVAALQAGSDSGRAWHATGNTGSVPFEPLELPPVETARRYDREIWRKIAEGQARVIFRMREEFDELRAAYAMTDADLWRTISQREQAA